MEKIVIINLHHSSREERKTLKKYLKNKCWDWKEESINDNVPSFTTGLSHPDKHILVKYSSRSGEYTFDGHTVLNVEKGCTEEDTVHNHFESFYPGSDVKTYEKAEQYSYFNNEIVVSITTWQKISEEDFQVLKRLVLCYP